MLAWFPKAFTGGCTEELKSLTAGAAEIAAYKAAVFTASFDTPEKNADFAEVARLEARAALRPEGRRGERLRRLGPGRVLREALDVLHRRERAIAEIDKNVNPATAGADIARKLGELGYPKR